MLRWLMLCENCLANIFPFNNLIDEDIFRQTLNDLVRPEVNLLLDNIQFNVLDSGNTENNTRFSNIDPDTNYLANIGQRNLVSNYYYEDSFNTECSVNGLTSALFSLMHMNIRSVPKHLHEFKEYHHALDLKFSLIGISETWLTNSTDQLYNLEQNREIQEKQNGRRSFNLYKKSYQI